ncbi:ribonuclease P [Candidatus Woesearchaeota archaeon]|nr:ribonuclease P [Candidatus Woesearchaeota archaeon]
MSKRISKKEKQEIALNKIKKLFTEASNQSKKNLSLSTRYVDIARKMAMKVNLRIPRELKRRFCKHCYHYLVPGKNCRVRIHKNKVIYYCADCKKYMRYMLTTKDQ